MVPPTPEHAARQEETLASIDAAGSPHKRAAAPLCNPRERCCGSSCVVEKSGTFYLALTRGAQLGRYHFRYYHRSRPHLALRNQCPVERQVMQDGEIVAVPELGGLHHRYERIAA
jgi:hypothetical protein